MAEQADGPWVRYEDVEKLQGIATKEQLAEAVTVGRLPLLQTIKDLEAQVKVLREDKEGGLPHFEVNVPMPPVKAAKVEGGVKRFGEVTESEILFGMKGVVESDDGDYMLFDDHINASMEVVELARKPLIEQIKALESQVREAREGAHQDRVSLASMVGMLHGVLCPPMDQDHLDELLEMVSSDNNETSNHAVKEIVVRILRVNQNPCGNCGS